MRKHKFEFNSFAENTYLLWDEQTLEAAVIDPGMSNAVEEQEFGAYVEAQGLRLVMALQTHCHFDHILGLPMVCRQFGLHPRFAEPEQPVYDAMPMWIRHLGIPYTQELPAAGAYLTEGEVLRLGATDIQVISTPGHTPGGISLYVPSERLVLTGDTLFKGNMGRTDLGGDDYVERQSILHRLLTLPSDTLVLPGHGPSTTVADECRLWGV